MGEEKGTVETTAIAVFEQVMGYSVKSAEELLRQYGMRIDGREYYMPTEKLRLELGSTIETIDSSVRVVKAHIANLKRRKKLGW